MRITLRQLEIFSAVARAGSTAAAADEVSLSQSAVSAAVNDLELSLGLLLFDRIGKRLILNDLGRSLQARADRLLDSARAVEKDFRTGESLAHLRIAASTTIGNYLIPGLLASYMDQHPGAKVEVNIGNSQEVAKAVSEFRVDAGVIEGPSRIPGLTLRHWRDDEMIVVAAPGHELAGVQKESAHPIPVDRLKSATWLFREDGSGTRDAVAAALFPHLGDLASSIVLGSSEAIKRTVGLGLGVSCLSRLLVQEMLDRGDLVELITELPEIVRPLHVVVHPERATSTSVSAFLQCNGVSYLDG
ncbi:LysR family transcriptional regulator [Caenimonas soli]|uniref:LysR family transcriptional regulator n=1 Tax=Caenimonas soli TaxID=2735555 RepID=UPI0015539BB8|nr:LysR family transcriptional regulator [Caenimonas soli]NPC57749.1 LysR family transcriptional regulator [Caenimonas soli]